MRPRGAILRRLCGVALTGLFLLPGAAVASSASPGVRAAAPRSCSSYTTRETATFSEDTYRFVTVEEAIRAKGPSCPRARQLIRMSYSRYVVAKPNAGVRFSVGEWQCIYYRPYYDKGHSRSKQECTRLGGQSLSWTSVELSKEVVE